MKMRIHNIRYLSYLSRFCVQIHWKSMKSCTYVSQELVSLFLPYLQYQIVGKLYALMFGNITLNVGLEVMDWLATRSPVTSCLTSSRKVWGSPPSKPALHRTRMPLSWTSSTSVVSKEPEAEWEMPFWK